MMYAATKATVKKAFQSGVVVDDIAATSKVNTLTLVRTRSRLKMCLLNLVEIRIESLSARGTRRARVLLLLSLSQRWLSRNYIRTR